MKVVQINAVDGILSTGVTTTQLSRFLSDNNIDNISVCRKDHCLLSSYTIGNIFDYRVHGLLSRITGLQGFFSLFPTLKLLYMLARFNPDVVHLRNLHENFINIPLLLWYLGKKDIATVVTLHDCFFYTGGCVNYTINNCNKWESDNCKRCPHKKEIGNYWFGCRSKIGYSYKFKLFHKIKKLGVIGVSHWVTNEAKRAPIFSGAKIIKPIYNWIDLDLFKEQPATEIAQLKKQMGLENKFIILGCCSHWSSKKGLFDQIALAKRLDKDCRIILIGNMPTDVELPENIISIPRTYHIEELVKYYAMADVFLHLSLEETFGKVTAEALSCGTPVIVYNSTASPELAAGGCGYIIDKVGDIDSVLNAVLDIRKHGKNYYSKNCRRKSISSFNNVANCYEYLDIYKALLD